MPGPVGHGRGRQRKVSPEETFFQRTSGDSGQARPLAAATAYDSGDSARFLRRAGHFFFIFQYRQLIESDPEGKVRHGFFKRWRGMQPLEQNLARTILTGRVALCLAKRYLLAET